MYRPLLVSTKLVLYLPDLKSSLFIRDSRKTRLVLTPLIISQTNFNYIQLNYDIIVPAFFIITSLLLISKFPSYSFKKIVIQRKTTIFLLFGIVLFFGLLLIYPFNIISISAVVYLLLLPISFFHYQKLKKQNQDKDSIEEEDDLEDVL